jgi:uroporphyrinogen decarboxylase
MAKVNDLFLRACRRQPTERTPIWLMRQAGRYMPEYRAIRQKHGFLQMVKTPELAAEITLQPVRAFGVDAAIIFADILPVLEGMGLRLTYEQGEGPIIHNPIKTQGDVTALAMGDPRECVGYTLDAIRLVKRELGNSLPVIGFSGAPFTLAAYAIEGGGSKDYRHVKQLMLAQPEAWRALMTKLADVVSAYLIAQIESGADAVQLFDSWAGVLSPFDYAECVLPYTQRVVATVAEVSSGFNPKSKIENRKCPIIYFGTDMSGLSGLTQQTGADVLGVDWRIYLDEAWAQLGNVAVQGNLDPAALFAPWPELERRAQDVLDRANGRPGHIFNLGHGIMTETPVDNVKRLVEFVHAASARQAMPLPTEVQAS